MKEHTWYNAWLIMSGIVIGSGVTLILAGHLLPGGLFLLGGIALTDLVMRNLPPKPRAFGMVDGETLALLADPFPPTIHWVADDARWIATHPDWPYLRALGTDEARARAAWEMICGMAILQGAPLGAARGSVQVGEVRITDGDPDAE